MKLNEWIINHTENIRKPNMTQWIDCEPYQKTYDDPMNQ